MVSAASPLIDQVVAASLGTGAVSSLNFGARVPLAVVGIGSLSLSTFVFPEFARLIVARDHSELREKVNRYTFLALIASIGLTLVLFAFSEPIVSLLFQHGAFTTADTVITSNIQALFLLQLPFHVSSMVLVRLISAFGRNYVLMAFGFIMVLVNTVADIVLAQWLGVPGIALATSIVFVISFCLLWFEARRVLRDAEASSA
jgi:putative peptidoglycan lipid II flippase